MYLLTTLTNLLPERWRPFAKALWPAILTIVAVGVQWVVTGEYDRAELVTTLTGLPSAIVTFFVPNLIAITGVNSAASPEGSTIVGARNREQV